MGIHSLPPGFRFHPTNVELVMYYLKRKVMGKKIGFDVISELDIYKFAPWDLPDKCSLKTGDLKWYFFSPRERKHGHGARMNRITDIGYWKTTGKDRSVHHKDRLVGMIKTLVFHIGRAPKGERTDWVMHEHRLEGKDLADSGIVQDSYVLCEVFQKSGPGPKNGAQYGAPFDERDWNDDSEVQCLKSVHPQPDHKMNPTITSSEFLPTNVCTEMSSEPDLPISRNEAQYGSLPCLKSDHPQSDHKINPTITNSEYLSTIVSTESLSEGGLTISQNVVQYGSLFDEQDRNDYLEVPCLKSVLSQPDYQMNATITVSEHLSTDDWNELLFERDLPMSQNVAQYGSSFDEQDRNDVLPQPDAWNELLSWNELLLKLDLPISQNAAQYGFPLDEQDRNDVLPQPNYQMNFYRSTTGADV